MPGRANLSRRPPSDSDWNQLKMLLRPKSVEEANAALRQCRIRSLDCAHMKLADAGCLVLSEGLLRGTMVQTLLLTNQKISVDGIKSLAPVVSKLPVLQELNLYRNRLGIDESIPRS